MDDEQAPRPGDTAAAQADASTGPAADRGGRWAFYKAVRGLSRPTFAAWFRLRREGLERVPRDGALIVAANHVSYLDPAILGSALPRPARFIMISGIWRVPVLNWFFRGMRAIPVDRDVTLSRKALRSALDALARGEVVGIFPEGGRVKAGEAGEALPGISLLARRSGAPVLATGISGTQRAMAPGMALPRPVSVRVRFGALLRHPGGTSRERDAAFAREVMDGIRALVEPAPRATP